MRKVYYLPMEDVAETQIFLGEKQLPNGFIFHAKTLFGCIADAITKHLLRMHSTDEISIPIDFKEFYLSYVFVRNKNTIQFNFKPVSDETKMMQATVTVQGHGGFRFISLGVSLGHLHSEDQRVLSNPHKLFLLTNEGNQSEELSDLTKLQSRIAHFLQAYEILNRYL